MAKTQQNSMRLSDAGYGFLAKHEGVRLRLYNDPSGHCTIGIGHLVHHGNCDGSEPENFRNGLTAADAKALLLTDIVRYENAVNAAVTVPLTQSQFDALVSFAYNEGAGAIHTLVKDTLNAGKPDAMCDDMVQHWTRSGKNPKMLLGRRQAEVALFKQSADTTADASTEHAHHSEQVLKLHQHTKPNLAEHITAKYQTPLLHTKLHSYHDAAKEKDDDGFVKRLLRSHGWLAPKGDRVHVGGSFVYAALHKFPPLRRFAGWQDRLDDGNESLSKRQMAGYIADGPQTKKVRDSVFYRSWGFFTESSHDILQEGADFVSLTSLYIDVAKTLAVASVGVTEGIDAPAIAPIVTALEGAGKMVGVVGASLNVYSTQAEAEHLGYRAVMGQDKGSNQNALLREFEQNNIDHPFAYLKWAVGEFKFLNPFKQIATAKKAGGFMGRAKSWMDWAGRLIKEASNTEWGQKIGKIVSWVKAAHQVYEFGRKVGQGLNLVWKTCVKNPAALLAHTAHYAWDVTKMGGHALSHLGSRALHLFGRGARRVGHGIGHFAHGAAHFAHDIFHSATHAIGAGVSHGAEIVHRVEEWMAERHFDPRRMAKDLALIGLHGVEQLTHTQVFKGLLEVPGHLLHHVLSGAKRVSDMATHSKLAHWLAEKRDATFAKVRSGVTTGWNGIKDAALHLPGRLFDAGGKVAHGAFDAFGGLAHRAFDGGSRLAHGAFGLGSNIAHRAFDNAGMMAHDAYDQGGALAHRIFDAGTGVAERLGLNTTLAHKVFNTGSAIANSLFHTGGTIANRAFDTSGTIANRAFHNAGGIANRVFNTAGNVANGAFDFAGTIANRAFHNISEIPSRAIDNILHPERTARRAFGNAGSNAHRAFDNADSIAHNVFDAGTGLAQRFGIDTTYANRAFNAGGAVANKVFNTGGSITNKTFETGMGMAKRAASLPGDVMQRVSQLGGFLPTFGLGLLPQPAFALPGGFSLPGGGLSAPSFGGIAQAAAPIAKTVGSLAGGALGDVTQAAGSAASAVGGFLGKTLGIQFSGQGGHPDVDAGSLLHGLKKQSSGFQPGNDLRGKLGGHLGFDPGGARLHTGPAAAQAARNLNAEAFTIGSDVFFGEGRFDPSSSKGLGLIAHELTHVGQQTGTTGDKTRFFTGRGGDEMEQEAQHVGERVLANAGCSHGVSVGLYDRRYESDGDGELAPSDQQRLDMISLMALTEAENLLWQRGIKGRKTLDALDIDINLDLSRMSNQEAAQVWAEAIVDQIAASQIAATSNPQVRAPSQVQRYPVGAPADADCDTVVNWLNSNSPYSGEWAETAVNYQADGIAFRVTGTAPDFTVKVRTGRVNKTAHVDMPNWHPQGLPMQRAWRTAWNTLRAHEAEHERIGREWKQTLKGRLLAEEFHITADNEANARSQATGLIQTDWATWAQDAQDAQSAIDPFSVTLDCPSDASVQRSPCAGTPPDAGPHEQAALRTQEAVAKAPGVKVIYINRKAKTITFVTPHGSHAYRLSKQNLVDGEFEASVQYHIHSGKKTYDIFFNVDNLPKGASFDFGYTIAPGQPNPSTFFGKQTRVRFVVTSGSAAKDAMQTRLGLPPATTPTLFGRVTVDRNTEPQTAPPTKEPLAPATDKERLLAQFEHTARQITMNVLQHARILTMQEASRFAGSDGKTLVDVNEMRRTARELAILDQHVRDRESEVMTESVHWYTGLGDETGMATVQTMNAAVERDPEVKHLRQQLETVKQIYGSRYPLLLAENANFSDIASDTTAGVRQRQQDRVNEVLKGIAETEKNISSDPPSLSIWDLPPIIDVTKTALGIAAGSPEAKVIDDYIKERKHSGTVKSIVLTALGIGLGLIAIFATGGLATIALVAGAGVSVYNTGTDYQKYMVESAGHRTSMDPARALVAEDPSIGWLVLDIVGAGLDVGAAAAAVRNMARTLRAIDELAKLGKVAQEGKNAAEVAQTLEDLAVEARAQYRVLKAEGKIAPGANMTEDAFVKRVVGKARQRLNGEVTEVTKAEAKAAQEGVRVDKPGERINDYRSYTDNSKVPARYNSDSRFNNLASDPAHAGTIDSKTRQEAMAGLEAEAQGHVPGPIERGPAEIEFYDGNGAPYDVKAPPSPKLGEKWSFKPAQTGATVKKELGKMFANKKTGIQEARRVILDSSYMSVTDHQALWQWLKANCTPEELKRIIEINTHK